jgi:endonuclease YncB( thermonuclease family)
MPKQLSVDRRSIRLCLLSSIVGWLVIGPAAAVAQSQLDPYETVDGEAQVVEGDTITIDGQTIRLYGIDAPEIGQTCRARDGREYDCGRASLNAVTAMLRGREATCTLFSRTPDGAAVGACEIAGHDVGAAIVTLGWAVSYRGLSNRYEYLESRARTRRTGLWSGRFDRPWVWRTREAQAQ